MQSEVLQKEHVTDQQGVQVAELARANNVSSEDFEAFFADESKVSKLFAQMNTDPVVLFEKLKISADKIGARIHMMTVNVDYDKSHENAAIAGGPQTRRTQYDCVLGLGHYYSEVKTGVVKETVVLVDWPGKNDYVVVEWGIKNNLRKTTPHVIFAIAEYNPQLNFDLRLNPMKIIETTGYIKRSNDLYSCHVDFDNANRASNTSPYGNYTNDPERLFVFSL